MDRVDELTSGEVAGIRHLISVNSKPFESTFGKKTTLKISLGERQDSISTPATIPITATQTMNEARSKNLMDLNLEIENRIKIRLEKEAMPEPLGGVSPRGGGETPMTGFKR